MGQHKGNATTNCLSLWSTHFFFFNFCHVPKVLTFVVALENYTFGMGVALYLHVNIVINNRIRAMVQNEQYYCDL